MPPAYSMRTLQKKMVDFYFPSKFLCYCHLLLALCAPASPGFSQTLERVMLQFSLGPLHMSFSPSGMFYLYSSSPYMIFVYLLALIPLLLRRHRFDSPFYPYNIAYDTFSLGLCPTCYLPLFMKSYD